MVPHRWESISQNPIDENRFSIDGESILDRFWRLVFRNLFIHFFTEGVSFWAHLMFPGVSLVTSEVFVSTFEAIPVFVFDLNPGRNKWSLWFNWSRKTLQQSYWIKSDTSTRVDICQRKNWTDLPQTFTIPLLWKRRRWRSTDSKKPYQSSGLWKHVLVYEKLPNLTKLQNHL